VIRRRNPPRQGANAVLRMFGGILAWFCFSVQ